MKEIVGAENIKNVEADGINEEGIVFFSNEECPTSMEYYYDTGNSVAGMMKVIVNLTYCHTGSSTDPSTEAQTTETPITETPTTEAPKTETPVTEPAAKQGTIKLTAKTLPIQVGKKTSVKSLVTGLQSWDKIASWKSSKPSVATISTREKITAKKKGTTTITVTLKSGVSDTFKVSVQKTAVKTKKITGVSKTLTIKKGKTATLKPVLTPITSTDKITYKSSNTKVATVSSKGKITAKKKGTAKITVKAGTKKVVCTVTVKK